jgi:hypothetical protein
MAKPSAPQGAKGLEVAAQHVAPEVTLPNLDEVFAKGIQLAAGAGPVGDHQPAPASQAGEHAAHGLTIAAEHVPETITLPDVSSLTGLDFFPHG